MDGGGADIDGGAAGELGQREKTSDFYETHDLPARFEYPSLLDYDHVRRDPSNPFYATTYNDYGHFSPTVHTVRKCYYGKPQWFSQEKYVRGMYRNHSLNL